MSINKKPLFNEFGDREITKKRLINGNTTNLNDFNNNLEGIINSIKPLSYDELVKYTNSIIDLILLF